VLFIIIDVFYYLSDRDDANDKRISKTFVQNSQYFVYIFLGILTTDLLDLDNIHWHARLRPPSVKYMVNFRRGPSISKNRLSVTKKRNTNG